MEGGRGERKMGEGWGPPTGKKKEKNATTTAKSNNCIEANPMVENIIKGMLCAGGSPMPTAHSGPATIAWKGEIMG